MGDWLVCLMKMFMLLLIIGSHQISVCSRTHAAPLRFIQKHNILCFGQYVKRAYDRKSECTENTPVITHHQALDTIKTMSTLSQRGFWCKAWYIFCVCHTCISTMLLPADEVRTKVSHKTVELLKLDLFHNPSSQPPKNSQFKPSSNHNLNCSWECWSWHSRGSRCEFFLVLFYQRLVL